MNKIVKELTQTEMSRKQFLQRIGLAALLITGLPALLKAITESHPQSASSIRSSGLKGYGETPYGGQKR